MNYFTPQHEQVLEYVGIGLIVLLLLRHFRRKAREHSGEVLFWWSPKDPFRVQDLLAGGILCLGRTGSGKTSSSGRLLAQQIIGHRNSSGLICAAKPEDAQSFRQLFQRAGRTNDLVVFDASGSDRRFNFVSDVLKHGGGSRELTRFFAVVGETLRAGGTESRSGDGEFWQREQERMLLNAIEIVRLARREVRIPEVQQFISEAASDPTMLNQSDFLSTFHYQCLAAAGDARKSKVETHDHELAERYWLSEMPTMADRTRSSIMTGVLGLLHVFNTGQVRELVSTTTNISPTQILAQRKWVLVNVPPATYGDIGNVINAGWKYLMQRAVLRRAAKSGDSFNVVYCDEAQQFANSFDHHYLAQCRSHLGCMVFLTQSMHSIHSAFKEDAGGHKAQALLANFSTKIFHALGDSETAQWASGLLGQRLETMLSGSSGPPQDLFDDLMGRGQFSGGYSTQYQPVVQPNVFLNGLRTGGKRNGLKCDAIVMKSGEPFANGENWLHVEFSQGDI